MGESSFQPVKGKEEMVWNAFLLGPSFLEGMEDLVSSKGGMLSQLLWHRERKESYVPKTLGLRFCNKWSLFFYFILS